LDEVHTQNWLSESKARVMEQWERDVASNIDSIWKTELENRLAEIERVETNIETGSILITYEPERLRANAELRRVEEYMRAHARRRSS